MEFLHNLAHISGKLIGVLRVPIPDPVRTTDPDRNPWGGLRSPNAVVLFCDSHT